MTARPPASVLRNLLTHEASGGLVLIVSSAAALALANSAASELYAAVLAHKVAGLSVLHWVDDGLMALFFVLVGLEIKRELLDGHLARWEHRVLPGVAAAGGMVAPALVYLAFNMSPETARGWGIPAATDIAFSLAVLAILGSRVPVTIKVLLTALAIVDDLGAIVIIALFYGTELSLPMLGLAAATMAALIALNRLGAMRLAVYAPLGLLLWYAMLKSGIHATVAGVLFALTIPLERSPGQPDSVASPLHRLENMLHPWVAFVVLPVFGFANAGVSLAGIGTASSGEPGHARLRARTVRRQADRCVRQRLARGEAWPGAPSGGSDLGAPLWHVAAMRHRLHHEPVHRSPGLRRNRTFEGSDQDRGAARFDRFRHRGLGGAAALSGGGFCQALSLMD